MNDIGERLEYILKIKGITKYQLSKSSGVSEMALGRIVKNVSKPNKSTLKSISDALSISMDWLESGNGLMFSDSKESVPQGVPYYDLDFTAGFLEVTNNQGTKPDSYINHPFFKGCDYVVRASGQSMAKVISHGDAIGLIKLNNWQDFFPFGEIYAIVTNDNFRMIKVITQGDSEEHYTLISKPTDGKKDEFPPQQIKKSSISAIFRVQASSHLF